MNPTKNWYVMVLEVMQRENVRTFSHFKTPLFLDRSTARGIGPATFFFDTILARGATFLVTWGAQHRNASGGTMPAY